MPRPLRIALFGCGTVGSQVARVLLQRTEELAVNSGVGLQLAAIVSRSTVLLADLPEVATLLTEDVERVIADPQIDVIVELMGGEDVAYQVVAAALRVGKHVVTANKALLAAHGAELFPLAAHRRACLLFEASCGGGIPLISTLQQGLIANRIHHFSGILNGTCNFILSQMDQGLSFQHALDAARRHGLVEANPELDLNGSDSVHKLTLMAELSYGCCIDYRQVPVSGLDRALMHALPHWLGLFQRARLSLRLLAYARWQGERLALSVAPTLLSQDDPLARLPGANNAVRLNSDLLGESLYVGAGAGGRATASAVLADLLAIGQGSAQALWQHRVRLPGCGAPAQPVPADRLEQEYACITRFQCGSSSPQEEGVRLLAESEGRSLLAWPTTTQRLVSAKCEQWKQEGLISTYRLLPMLTTC